ncbi:TBC1 domain family member 12-like isoform X2 [Nerophis lumbriciformis]|uniref:TBC1 domain family member 12-like isoform X2 n=1 Tax=Nerophis lumbriciformis TaxID=546530 RepID=UPI002ADFA2AE|nr:TBC1 domain family member 12-like isoform X2 [Nerophis lumbriciformis]
MAATRERGGRLVVDVNENEEDEARRLKCALALRQGGDVSAGHDAEVDHDGTGADGRSPEHRLTCLNGTTESWRDEEGGGGPGVAASCPAVTPATSRHAGKNRASPAGEEDTDGFGGPPCLGTKSQASMPNGDADHCGPHTDLCGPHADLCGPLADHCGPLADHCGPLADHCGPLADHCGPLADHCGPLADHCGPLADHCGPQADHCGPLADLCGPLADHCGPLADHCGPLADHCGPLAGHCGPLADHCGPLADHCGPRADLCGARADLCGPLADHCGPLADLCGPRADHKEPRQVNGGFHAYEEAQSGVWSSGDCSGGSAGPPASVDSPGAGPPSPAPSAASGLSEDSSPSEQDCSGPGLVGRPRSLRTEPNLAVSLSCDATPLSPADDGGFGFGDQGDFRNTFETGRRQSAPDQLPVLNTQLDCSESKLMPKRFGIADFFTRSLFSKRAKDSKASAHNASGRRAFNKPREEDAAKDSAPSSTEQRPLAAGRKKNLEFEPLSTTALILEDRPPNLPAKSVEETQRHKLEYEEMVAGAKRRELKEAQKKKRQMKERHRHEDSISNAMVVWNTQILPHWDTMKGTRRVRDLWWQGLPPSVRGRVWSLAIGNELNITAELYDIFLCRAKEKWRSYSETSSVNDSESDGGASLADRESSLDLIKLDISRTFPSLFIFQKGGPYHDLLHSVLGAYTCYRPDIGYVQGMSFIAAVLILNLEEAEAFITFANLLNKPCQMAFFRVDHELMLKYFAVFEVFFEENLPRLFSHFQTNKLTPDLYLIDWIFTLYSKSLPLDVACRVWDVFCRDGEESLFRTGLGILRLFEDVLLQMDFIHIAQFLSRLPEDLQAHTLFAAMASTHMISRNRRWAQVFSSPPPRNRSKDGEKNGSPALRS